MRWASGIRHSVSAILSSNLVGVLPLAGPQGPLRGCTQEADR